MSLEERLAANVVTSENLAEFNAQRLGLADKPEPAVEPVAEDKQSDPVDAEDEATVTEERKRLPKIERRFEKVTKDRDQAKAEAQQEREKRETLEARIKELEGRTTQKADEEPKPEQFNDAFEYAKALAEYSTEKAMANRDRQEAERKVQLEREKVIKTWTDRLTATKTELPDFEDMVSSSEVMVSDQVRDAILESDTGPRILYHLAENPEFATKLQNMTVTSALREIGKLEARFEKPPEKAVAVRSKAPAPINPIKVGSAGKDTGVDSNNDFHGTYHEWKASRLAGKIR